MRASAREKTTPSRKKSCPRCVPGLAATRNRRRNRDQRRRTMAVGRLTQKKPDPCSFVIFGVTGGNRLFYLATPPNAFLPISCELGRTGMLAENGAWRRLVVEKPFGTDLASAMALNSELLKLVKEQQIYRIDHYLGKETVQNILVLRFANGMFEPIWNRNHIDHIQITVDEKLGVGHRGSFYDATGALRDMVPNH